MTGGVLFDFDGTLADTFDDIVEAVQRMRAELDGPALPPAEIRRHIGWGTRNLIGMCLPSTDVLRPERLPPDGNTVQFDRTAVEDGLQRFERIYEQVMVLTTQLYPGILELCRSLAADGIDLAVVSNKQDLFVRRMMAALRMIDPFRVVVGAGLTPRHKPDPSMLFLAAGGMGLPIDRCLMVGDGPLDIASAKAAGIPCCAVSWGLLPADQLIRLGPATLVHDARELDDWLRGMLRARAL
ncbi:MAG: HAD-IA family hydrolase [Candidatus Eisenbacteria bacterium]